jgi:hypothetical protein
MCGYLMAGKVSQFYSVNFCSDNESKCARSPNKNMERRIRSKKAGAEFFKKSTKMSKT